MDLMECTIQPEKEQTKGQIIVFLHTHTFTNLMSHSNMFPSC